VSVQGAPTMPEGRRAGADGYPGTEPGLLHTTVHFCRELRQRGVLATPAEAVDAARALDAIDVGDEREVYLALRAVLVGRVEDYPHFDEVFHAVWAADEADAPQRRERRDDDQEPNLPEVEKLTPRPAPAVSLDRWIQPGQEDDEEPVGMPTVGDTEALGTKDFGTFGSAELDEIHRVAARLARRLVARPSRRWRTVRRGPRVHPRRTLRQGLRTGGEVVQLAFRRRRLKRTKLVLLCDVSGSMDLYSRFLLQFLYAMQNAFSRVETFVFSTRLRRVTMQLRGDSYRGALRQLAAEVREWSGGTRIGESLAQFNEGWPRLVDRRTVVVVLSDGWETGDPETLGEAMRAIRRRAGKTIWLNPLAGSPDYQPLTRGMQAALPHVDHFASAHNLASLQALVRHLVL
jgi:uncharacterized protein